MRELICHKRKNWSWKKGHYLAEVATYVFYRKAIENAKKKLWLNLPVKNTSEVVHF